jgi:PAS domain S-box-containing protein
VLERRRRPSGLFYKLSFASKILAAMLVLLVSLGFIVTIGIQLALRSLLQDEVATGARALAIVTAQRAAPLVAVRDRDALAGLVEDVARSDAAIAYALVVDRAGEVVAHTFAWDPPDAVVQPRRAPSPVRDDEYRLVRYDGHTYVDVAAPILAGAMGAGTLQIGIRGERIDGMIRPLILLFLVMFAGVIAGGSVVARGVFRRLTRPVRELTLLADQLSVGRLDVDFDFGVPVRCWEIKQCRKTDCAAYHNTSEQCWFVDGTPCEGYESRFPQKLVGCRTCEVYQRHKGDEVVQLYDSFRHMTNVLQRSQADLMRSDRFQRSLIHNSFDGIIATNEDDTIAVFNRAAELITGYDEADVVGRKTWDEMFVTSMRRETEQPLFSDGSRVIFGFYRRTATLRRKDGDSVEVRASGITLRDGDRHVGKVFFFQDLREVNRLREELVRKERLAATGQTVAAISHSMKNILEGLRGGAYVYKRGVRVDDRATQTEGWAMVERNIDHISGLVADLLNYARDRTPDRTPTDPGLLAADVIETLRGKAEGQGISLEARADPAVSLWLLDAHAMHQCLVNLVTNALDATASVDSGWVRLSVHLTPADQLEFRVQDNGPGVPPNLADQLFLTMVSTKGARGSGLGLLVSHKIVAEHGGSIALDPQMGPGATFRVFLPRVAG